MRNFLYAAVATVVAGCVTTTNPAAMQAAETAGEYLCLPKPYPAVTGCVREQFDLRYPGWRRDANADLVDIFFAWSQAAGDRVEHGELADAEAHRQAEMLHDRLNQIAYERRVQRQIDSEVAAQRMLTGLAILSLAQPAQYVPPAQPVYGGPITCRFMAATPRLTTVNCF